MFNLIVLILVTIVFLMFGYLITHADIFSPFCVFCEMFLIAEFLCLFFVRMYKVEIHLNTSTNVWRRNFARGESCICSIC